MIETLGIISVAVITSIVGPILVEKVKSRLRNKKPVDPIVNDHEHCSVIADEIEEVRKLLNADRTWILMYHNGGHFLTNEKSMKKFSMMFETCKDEKGLTRVYTHSELPRRIQDGASALTAASPLCLVTRARPPRGPYALTVAALVLPPMSHTLPVVCHTVRLPKQEV